MALSVLDLFSVGIGPSSSHTVGPMRAAKLFADGLKSDGQPELTTARVQAELFGSLGATGRGHGSDKAVVLGLQGQDPETVDTDTADDQVAAAAPATPNCGSAATTGWTSTGTRTWSCTAASRLPAHPNGMTFRALDHAGAVLSERSYYSDRRRLRRRRATPTARDQVVADDTPLPYPFTTGRRTAGHLPARGHVRSRDVMLANELVWRTEAELREKLLALWAVMRQCVDNGCAAEGILPGGLNVRAPRRRTLLLRTLTRPDPRRQSDPLRAMEWVNLFALAVNEENAAGGRIVTAPTNGAAGIVPAVLHYYVKFVPGADDDGVVRFLLTAAAVGILFKINASISGAEVGCQGEVGSACSMAAGGLCEVLGGTPEQVENAAEVGIEHNLGLTCDPVGGLVQIPCIERNAIASVKAINAARLALHGDGSHKVSLDKAIKTMRETGADMKTKYKETSRGGLAVNVDRVLTMAENQSPDTVEHVLTLDCPESPGIVHAVSGFLLEHGCDIIDSKQFDDRCDGHFFMRRPLRLGRRCDTTADTLRDAFAPVADKFGMSWQLEPHGTKRRVLIMVSKFEHCLNDLLFRARTGELPIDDRRRGLQPPDHRRTWSNGTASRSSTCPSPPAPSPRPRTGCWS